MKMVRALIRPFELDAFRTAVVGAGFQGMTVLEAMKFRRHAREQDVDRAAECETEPAPMYEVEAVVSDASVDEIVKAISGAGITGMNEGEKILVSSIDQAIRIRTGETGADAL